MSDTQTNTWVSAINITQSTTSEVQIWYVASSKSAAADTVTVTFASSTSYLLQVDEVTGCRTTAPLDKTSTGTGTSGTALSVTTFTPTNPFEFVYAAAKATRSSGTETFTAGTNYTIDKQAATSPSSGGSEWFNETTAVGTTSPMSVGSSMTSWAEAAVSFYTTIYTAQSSTTVTATQTAQRNVINFASRQASTTMTFTSSAYKNGMILASRQALTTLTLSSQQQRNAILFSRQVSQGITVTQSAYSRFIHTSIGYAAQAIQAITATTTAIRNGFSFMRQGAQSLVVSSSMFRNAVSFSRDASQTLSVASSAWSSFTHAAVNWVAQAVQSLTVGGSAQRQAMIFARQASQSLGLTGATQKAKNVFRQASQAVGVAVSLFSSIFTSTENGGISGCIPGFPNCGPSPPPKCSQGTELQGGVCIPSPASTSSQPLGTFQQLLALQFSQQDMVAGGIVMTSVVVAVLGIFLIRRRGNET